MDELSIKSRTDAEKEASHREAEKGIQSFTYAKPDTSGPRPKQIVQLVRGELAGVSAQIVKEGGENNLHYHTGRDGLWFVLRGRVRFYGVGDELLGEYGPDEGILLPAGSRYWFEKVGDEELEILQFVAHEQRRAKTSRINIEAHKDWMEDNAHLKVYDK